MKIRNCLLIMAGLLVLLAMPVKADPLPGCYCLTGQWEACELANGCIGKMQCTGVRGACWTSCQTNSSHVCCPRGVSYTCANILPPGSQTCPGTKTCNAAGNGWVAGCVDDPVDFCPCTDTWTCGNYGSCVGGIQNRTCTKTNSCQVNVNKPPESQPCSGIIKLRNSSIYDPDASKWLVTTFDSYNDYGQILEETDALGMKSSYEYYPIPGITGGNGFYGDLKLAYSPTTGSNTHFTEYAWHDDQVKLKSVKVKVASNTYATTEYGYDNFGRLTSIKKPDPSTGLPETTASTTYSYSSSLSADETVTETKRISATGQMQSEEHYDAFGRNYFTKFINAGGTNIITKNTYDSAGRLEKQFKPKTGNTPADIADTDTKTTFAYLSDPLEKLTTITPPDDATITGTETQQYSYGIESGKEYVKLKDEKGYYKKSIFDEWGNKVSSLEGSTDGTSFANDNTFAYTFFGSMDSAVDSEAHLTDYNYDGLGRLTSALSADFGTTNYKYNDLGKVIEKGPVELLKNPSFESVGGQSGGIEDWDSGSGAQSQGFAVESNGCRTGFRCIKAAYGNWWANQRIKLEPNTDYSFSVWLKVNASSGTSPIVLIESVDKHLNSSGAMVYWRYMSSYFSPFCSTSETVNGWQHRICNFNTNKNADNQPHSPPITDPYDPRLNANVYIYSGTDCPPSLGWDICKTRFNWADDISLEGPNILYSYDELGRLTKIDYPSTWPDTSYTYDTCTKGNGRICRIIDDSGSSAFTYDSRGRVASVIKTTNDLNSGSAIFYTTSYTYTDSDQQKTVAYPSGLGTATYQYDNFGRISAVEDPNRLATITYYPSNTVDFLKFGSAASPVVTTDYEYHLRDNLKSANTYRGSTPSNSLYKRSFKYDAGLNLETVRQGTDPQSTTDPIKGSYSYDVLHRLSANPVSETGKSLSFTYDEAGNRQTETYAGLYTRAYTYEYELVGGNSQKLLQFQTAIAGGPTYNSYMSYDKRGNLISRNCGSSIDCISASFEYDPDNNLIKATKASGGTTEHYTYDYSGQRVRKDSKTAQANSPYRVVHYIYDLSGNQIFENEFSAPSTGASSSCGIDKKTGAIACK